MLKGEWDGLDRDCDTHDYSPCLDASPKSVSNEDLRQFVDGTR